MQITSMGQVRATVAELLALRLTHITSATDTEPDTRWHLCGTSTTLTGYTEWMGQTELPVSIGWDWRVDAGNRQPLWRRDDLPRTNLQLVDGNGVNLSWEQNLSVIATLVDAIPWQEHVASALITH